MSILIWIGNLTMAINYGAKRSHPRRNPNDPVVKATAKRRAELENMSRIMTSKPTTHAEVKKKFLQSEAGENKRVLDDKQILK